MMHYPDDELAKLSKRRTQAGDDAAMESHVAGCADCGETVELFEEMDKAFRKPEVWSDVALFTSRPSGMQMVLAEAVRIERQNAEGLRRLKPLLRSPIHFEDADVAGNPRFCDAGVVRMLTAEAAARRDSQPKFALQLATAACFVARNLPDEPRQSQQLLLACALREQANALRFVGSFKEALAALNEAEPIFRTLPDGAHDLGIVDYIRGLLLLEFEDGAPGALRLARSAIRSFRHHGDQYRELSARLVEAMALGSLEGSAAAAEAYERVISLSERIGQRDIAAHAYHNAGIHYAELGRFETAERSYAEALARYDELGNTAHKANTEWEFARLLVLRGQLEIGAKALAVARRKLFELGLRESHGLATLDWAGARLALNQPEGVAAACQEIIPRYQSEGAMRNARLALAYIHEALHQGTATPQLLGQVRDYLTKLPRKPSVAFQPET